MKIRLNRLASGFFFLLLVTSLQAATGRAPNVIFILADDLGYGDIGAYGQTKIKTPNLDRMSAEGMRFTQHYSGNAVCAPSRCVLMTGMHPGHAFIRNNRQMEGASLPKIGKPSSEGQHPIPAETVTMAELFQSAGYVTGGFGKWGLGGPGSSGEPLKQGFNRWFGYNCQGVAHNFYPTYLWDNDKTIDLKNPPFASNDKLTPAEDPAKAESYKRFQGTEYSADLIAEKARDFVRENQSRPFFLYWPTTVPHVALQVPDDSLKEYLGKWEDAPYVGGKGYTPHFKPKAAYAAMITRMDREIGAMIKLITELGLDENTIFVFTSDNGPLTGTHQGLAGTDGAFFNSSGGLRDGKGTLYEGGYRVPGIIRWKGQIKAGSTSERVTGFEDWMPTLMELVGVSGKTPKNLDGISFAPTLMGKSQLERPFLYREFPAYTGQQSVRIGDWKGIRRNLARKDNPDYKIELYDLKTDRAETKDVSAAHPEIIARMEKLMREQHRKSADFPFPALDKLN
ncbi:MAG TPA: arylsulfatase [Verrucomicrobiae bacterium]